MKVLIYISSHGREYCWDELTEEEKQQFRSELNKQTAKNLGYQ